jgi:DNA-binding NarL/FixJ family response regulator
MALRVLKAGARGYLNKQSAAEELVIALRKLLSGGRYISHAFAETLADEVREARQASDRPPHERLSNREYQVFGLLVEGRSIKEIAERMSLSAKTVSTYRVRLCEKLGVKNVVELAHYAHQHRLFT